MEEYKNIISLDNTTPDKAHIGGGKFVGLAQIKPLLAKYKEQYGVDFELPKTFAITTDAFKKYDIAHNGIPEDVINQAMQCMVACGGNVAVRSSADIEDLSGKTHSGEFESVLSIKNKQQMIAALQKVYQSAQNVNGAQMGVIIQPMIDTPTMAGVLYSQDFNGDPLVAINWTQGKPANFLLVNKEQGNLTKISKYVQTDYGYKLFEFPDIKTRDNRNLLHSSIDNCMMKFYVSSLQYWNMQYITQLTALANHLEKDLGYPVDIEFAISKDGKISVLQQRPYIMNNNYVVKQLENGDLVGYNKNNPIVAGEVKIVDYFISAEEYQKAKENKDFANKILLSKSAQRNNSFMILAWADMDEDVLQSKLKIDACYRIHSELYGHYGNQFRERGTPFFSTQRNAEFQHVKDGDWLKIDLRTGTFKTFPQKDKSFNIANVVQMLQNRHYK